MNFTFRPATREHTPLIIGIAGPTKSGKTMSSLRLATGLAAGGPIVMLNAEGPRGHQYAERFKYLACELSPPFRATYYTDALREARKLKPAVTIIDSVSHMHDGPGGALEWHEEELDRMAGDDFKKRERSTFAAWVKIKAAETQFIYEILAMDCAVILAMRAKEKIRIVKGKPPIDLGWQPIVGERVAFETIFTLMLPPHSRGVPDLSISDMREPFDTLVPIGQPIDEALGKILAAWARGSTATPPPSRQPAADAIAEGQVHFEINGRSYVTHGIGKEAMLETFRLAKLVGEMIEKNAPAKILRENFGVDTRLDLTAEAGDAYIRKLKLACGEPVDDELDGPALGPQDDHPPRLGSPAGVSSKAGRR